MNTNEEGKKVSNVSLDGFRYDYSFMNSSIDEFDSSREHLQAGDLIFEYKNNNQANSELYNVCVRVNNRFTTTEEVITEKLDMYIVEIITKNYAVIYPHVPRTYLEVELYELLEGFNLPKDILVTYKQIIEDLKV